LTALIKKLNKTFQSLPGKIKSSAGGITPVGGLSGRIYGFCYPSGTKLKKRSRKTASHQRSGSG
jgi:hypothetical protein